MNEMPSVCLRPISPIINEMKSLFYCLITHTPEDLHLDVGLE